jgi:hypothetical protein
MVATMTITRRLLTTVAAIVLLAIAPSAAAQAATRPPIKDCGDVATIDGDQFFIGAVTAQGTTCTNARAIARTSRAPSAASVRAPAVRERTPACSPRRARS